MISVRCVLVSGILLLAIYKDYQTFHIPNLLHVAGWLASWTWHVLQGGLVYGTHCFLMGAVFPIIALWIFFVTHTIGAGDIKLFSVIGSFYGVSFVSETFVLAVFFAGGMSLFQIIRTHCLMNRLHYLADYLSRVRKHKRLLTYMQTEKVSQDALIHMSSAIAAGFWATLFAQVVLQ